MEFEATILLLIVTVLVIAAAAVLAPKLRVPAPLILVLAGIAVSVIPATPEFIIDPQLVLLLLLPPLLYATAASMPVMNFRRDFAAINGLSVILVVISALALGGIFAWLIPDLGFGWGVALGAVLSPTDAAAVAIIKGRGVPDRVAVILDGESLLNDATAIILMRTAIVATAAGFSFWPTVGEFLLSVFIAVSIGSLAAFINLEIRRRVPDAAVNTILSFTTPFLAALPAELLHGSGLVAAVVAGMVTGIRAPRVLPPGHRMSERQNWATVEVVLEGLIFLTMGLQLSAIVEQVSVEPNGVAWGVGLAVLSLAVMLALRTLYVTPLLWRLHRRAERRHPSSSELAQMHEQLAAGRQQYADANGGWSFDGAQMFRRLARRVGDIDYLSRQPLGKRDTAVVIWAGMRGAVTVAAVQLLPITTPHRPLLVFIAFAVASLSLLLQGGTIGLLAARLFPPSSAEASERGREMARRKIRMLLDGVAARYERKDGTSEKEWRIGVLRMQRQSLLDARDDGIFDAAALEEALLDVDVDEMVLELRDRQASAQP